MQVYWVFLCLNLLHGEIALSSHDVFQTSEVFSVNSNGQVLISCSTNSKLLCFDSNGAFLGSMGKQGDGPGEFQSFTSIVWDLKKSSFWVLDGRSNRLTRIDSSLNVVEVVSLKAECNRPVQIKGDRLFIERDNNGERESEPHIAEILFRESAKETAHFKMAPLTKQYGLHGKFGKWVFFRSYEWDPRMVFGLGTDFSVVSYTENPSFQIFSDKGKQTTISVPLTRVLLTEDVFTNILKTEHSKEMLPTVIANIKRPVSWPPIKALLVDNRDQIWVFSAMGKEGKSAFVCYNKNGERISLGTSPYIPSQIFQNKGYTLIDKNDEIYLSSFELTGVR